MNTPSSFKSIDTPDITLSKSSIWAHALCDVIKSALPCSMIISLAMEDEKKSGIYFISGG